MIEKETVANVMYTKDINKKNNKKWIDGIATFISTNNPNRYRFILRDLEGNLCDDTYYKSPNMDGLLPEPGGEDRIGKFLITVDSFTSNPEENQESNNEENSDFITELRPNNNSNFQKRYIKNQNDQPKNFEEEPSNTAVKQFPQRTMKKVGLSRKGIKPLNIYSTPQPNPENGFNSNNNFSTSNNFKRNTFTPPRQIDIPNPPSPSNPNPFPTPQHPNNHNKPPPSTISSSSSSSNYHVLRKVPRTLKEIIQFWSIHQDKTEENDKTDVETVEHPPIAPEKENPKDDEIDHNDEEIDHNDGEITNEPTTKPNPTNVLEDALSSDNESLTQIIRRNIEDDSSDDGDLTASGHTKSSMTTGTDEQDSIVSSEASSVNNVPTTTAVLTTLNQPFKPPTELLTATFSEPESNASMAECLRQEIGLLWGSKLRTIGKRPPKIPVQFSGIEEYKHFFIQGIVFEMNSKILDVYSLYQAAMFTACNKSPFCRTHGMKMAFYINSYNGSYYYACTKPGCKNRQSVPPDAMLVDLEQNESGEGMKINGKVRNKAAIESFMKKKHVAYHESRMFRTKENQVYLMFNTDKDESIDYNKDDVWVIFSERLNPFFVISESYGVYSNTKIEVGPFFNNELASMPQQLRVTAIRVFNAQSERQAIVNLLSLTEQQMPIIPVLLGGGTVPSYLSTADPMSRAQSEADGEKSDSEDGDYVDPSFKEQPPQPLQIEPLPPSSKNVDIQQIASDICDRFELNEDQRKALFKVADFFNDENEPMLLVHGLFGAGKSKLLSVIAIFLDIVLSELGRSDKILVAASTNVAVDNVLSNLFEFEHLSFTRVGSVKKIRRSLLPFVTGHGTEESISELSSIMHDTLQPTAGKKKGRGRRCRRVGSRSVIDDDEDDDDEDDCLEPTEMGSKRLSAEAEKRVVQEALMNAENEMKRKVSKIDSCRIVGVTCAACSFAVMTGRTFPFVLLDECSQQTEAISLIPMSFGCRCLVCCGDPKQLPPTLNKEAPDGYGRPLFTRMMTMVEPIVLSIQYRCHPRIADICSYAFYNGKVRSGISEEDRPPLYQMPTLCVFNVACGEEEMRGGSIYNTAEAITVINLVKYLINVGVSPDEIGVIAFYKAQAEQIAAPLSEGRRRPVVDVSTVDAFQGDEREVIIISTAKTKQSSFVDSPNRINVAISRAKRHLFFVSKVSALVKLDKWNFVINRAGNKPNVSINLNNAPDSNWLPFD